MFVGHGLLAFALVALLGERLGWSRSRLLRVAALAALFATLPDVDVVYGPVGLLGVSAAEPGLAESFWAAGNRVHRGATHSLVVGAATAADAWFLARREPALSAVGLAVLGGVVAVVAAVSGGLAGVVTLVFAVGAVALVHLGHLLRVPARETGVAALVGLLTHPFGDLFTGEPPSFLYPLDLTLVGERVVLAADPTLHLLGAFAAELAVGWLALYAFSRVSDRGLRAAADRRAALGVAYAVPALALPAPTLEVSYHFVFSVIGFGLVAAGPRSLRQLYSQRAATTGLTAVTLATVTYATVYLTL